MNRALQRYVEAASGLTTLTTAKAEQIARQLVRSGEAAQDQVSEVVDELLERQRRNREALANVVKSETDRAVRMMGLASSTEVERLQRQVAELEREIARLERQGGRTRKAAGKKSSSKTSRTSGGTASKKASRKAGTKTSRKAGRKSAKKAGKKTARKATKKAAKKSGGSTGGGA